jgi:ribonucleoside-diphosphate reductase alpha chain
MIADCSSGCEPYYSVITEKHVMDGEKLLMVNRHFEIVAKREGFYSEELIQEINKKGTVVGNKKVPAKWQKIFVGAMDISPEGHLKMQACLQNNGVDSSISKTVNMPKSATIQDVNDIYYNAWKSGCKGVTIYRDGSKSFQVLNTGTQPTVFNRPDGVEYTMAPVRPKILPVDIFHSSVKGVPWVVLVGLLNDRPYEIFAGELDDLYIPKSCKSGFVEKHGTNGDSTYALTIKIRQQEVVYKQIAGTLMNSEQKALTRMISLSLRHGVHYEFIVNQLKKSSGEITDFAAVVNRILSKYIKQYEFTPDKMCPECGGKIAFVEGCEKCLSCGVSKCG